MENESQTSGHVGKGYKNGTGAAAPELGDAWQDVRRAIDKTHVQVKQTRGGSSPDSGGA